MRIKIKRNITSAGAGVGAEDDASVVGDADDGGPH